jgi:hypothetical protein
VRFGVGCTLGLRFGVQELEVLARAAGLADREAELRMILDRDGMMSCGSRGQVSLHPAAGELRLVESQVVALLRQVSLEDTAGKARSPKSRRAATAARARWDRRDDLAAKRKAAGV